MLQTSLGRKKYEEAMSDEHPPKNKLDILRNCKKLKGTNFSVFEDFSKETASIGIEKWKEVLKNQKDGKISYLQSWNYNTNRNNM